MESFAPHEITNVLVGTKGNVAAAARFLDEMETVMAGPKMRSLKELAADVLKGTTGVSKVRRTGLLGTRLPDRRVQRMFLYELNLDDFLKNMEDHEASASFFGGQEFLDTTIRGYMIQHGYEKYPWVFPDPRGDKLYSKLVDSHSMLKLIQRNGMPPTGDADDLAVVTGREMRRRVEDTDFWYDPLMTLLKRWKGMLDDPWYLRMYHDHEARNAFASSFVTLTLYLTAPGGGPPVPFTHVLDSTKWDQNMLSIIQGLMDNYPDAEFSLFDFKLHDIKDRTLYWLAEENQWFLGSSVQDVLDALKNHTLPKSITDDPFTDMLLLIEGELGYRQAMNRAIEHVKTVLIEEHEWEWEGNSVEAIYAAFTSLEDMFNIRFVDDVVKPIIDDFTEGDFEPFVDHMAKETVSKMHAARAAEMRELEENLTYDNWPADDPRTRNIRLLRDSAQVHNYDAANLVPIYAQAGTQDTEDSLLDEVYDEDNPF